TPDSVPEPSSAASGSSPPRGSCGDREPRGRRVSGRLNDPDGGHKVGTGTCSRVNSPCEQASRGLEARVLSLDESTMNKVAFRGRAPADGGLRSHRCGLESTSS